MDSRQFAGFLVGALLIAGLGVVDDMKNLPAKLKILRADSGGADCHFFRHTDSGGALARNGIFAEI